MRDINLKVHAACLGIAVAVLAILYLFQGYMATYATLAIEASREFTTTEQALILSAHFVARYFIFLAAGLLAAAYAAARLIEHRA